MGWSISKKADEKNGPSESELTMSLLHTIKEQIDTMGRKMVDLHTTLHSHLDSTSKAIQNKLNEKSEQEDLSGELFQLRQCRDQATSENAALQKKVADQNMQLSSHNSQLSSLRLELSTIRSELASKNAELDFSNKQLSSQREQLDSLQSELRQATQQKEALDREKQELRRELDSRQTANQQLTQQLSAKTSEAQNNEQKCAELTGQIEKNNRTNESRIEELLDMLRDYDEKIDNIPEDRRAFVYNVIDRLHAVLVTFGLEEIDGETSFDSLRHQSVPRRVIPEGTRIIKTIVPGLCQGPKVLFRAKVEVESVGNATDL